MGRAMGTTCAPSYVNIFMASFEAKHIYPYIKESLLYLRYIHDISMTWRNTKAKLMAFIKQLNENHNIIKLDFQISARKHFLTQCYIKTNITTSNFILQTYR